MVVNMPSTTTHISTIDIQPKECSYATLVLEKPLTHG
jgi:hypothetical protein